MKIESLIINNGGKYLHTNGYGNSLKIRKSRFPKYRHKYRIPNHRKLKHWKLWKARRRLCVLFLAQHRIFPSRQWVFLIGGNFSSAQWLLFQTQWLYFLVGLRLLRLNADFFWMGLTFFDSAVTFFDRMLIFLAQRRPFPAPRWLFGNWRRSNLFYNIQAARHSAPGQSNS